nr:hypothetical protein [Chloroflexota bacterium]
MQSRVVTRDPWDVETDVLAIPIASDEEEGRGQSAADELEAELDRRLGGVLGDLRRIGEVSGKAYGGALVRGAEMGAAWLLPMGIGKVAEVDRLTLVRFGAAVERRLGGRLVKRLAIYLPASIAAGTGPGIGDAVELVTRGVVEGTAEPGAIYREAVETAPPELDELLLVVPGGDESALQARADRGRVIGEGANRARRLSQRASNDVSPEVLADEATALAKRYGLAVEVHGPEWATEQGMGMFMAVGRGSDNPPRFIVLRSGERGASAGNGRLLAMVGKGVTFDSGGISIKPADRMEEMKMDKTG